MLYATDQGSSSGGGLLTFLPIILLVAAMYFLMIRPQSRKRREAQQLQSSLVPGDEVQTVGGLYATVLDVDDDAVTLQAAPGVSMRYARGAIARVIRPEPRPEAEDDSDASKTIEQG